MQIERGKVKISEEITPAIIETSILKKGTWLSILRSAIGFVTFNEEDIFYRIQVQVILN